VHIVIEVKVRFSVCHVSLLLQTYAVRHRQVDNASKLCDGDLVRLLVL